ncbi:hypothetical protein DPMN_153001 [Dreissena polymorpha]|uniref:Uncharacterized protein n=1 Tax=Dreissena polymorpha TaxID=45954 RepID=A0A9D4FLF8_DREPO|nr:hypothetical protein DPMN_153001 [Dreissena polymorpha]
MDQYVFPANRSNKTVSPAGNTLPIFFDSSLVSGNKYDNFSLVSGFLNDSLNSLLSANTESQSDTESSSDRECTGQGVVLILTKPGKY